MGVNLPHIIIKPAQKDVGFTTDSLNIFYIFHFTPDVIAVPADSAYQKIEDLINAAKNNPGKIKFSGSGIASANHLAQIKFDKLTNIDTRYQSFKGTSPAAQALLDKQVTAQWGSLTLGKKLGDKVRILAVAMKQRHPVYPDIPTFKELGIDMIGGAYRGLALPRSASDDIKQQWSDMISEINADPIYQQQMLNYGFVLTYIDSEHVDEFIKERTKEYLDDAKSAGLIDE